MDSASLTTTPLATYQQEKRASGQECGEPRDRGTAALAGVALGLAVALGLLTLPLHEFRVDGAQTPLTGHLPPPPHHVGVPKATGGVLQIGEPSMDGVRHEGPPAPPAEPGGAQPRCLQRECGERRKRCLYGRSWHFPMEIDPQYHPSLFWDTLQGKSTPQEMTLLLRCALPGAEGRGVSATCLSLPPAQLLGVRTSSAAKA
jgi:hypothetical protein